MSSATHVDLVVRADAQLARLVRMTAANVGMLSSMSVERIEDIKMAAEEAFIYACGSAAGSQLAIGFDATEDELAMTFTLELDGFPEPADEDPAADYAELLMAAVCDSFEKRSAPAALVLRLKADI